MAEERIFVDSSVLISCGRRDSTRFRALAREARQRDAVFRIPPQVYTELTGNSVVESYDSRDFAVDEAIQEGWIRVTESPSYSMPAVSKIMDQTRRFIATATDRPEDIVEKTDTEMIGIGLEVLLEGTATHVTIVTNDVPLGQAGESLIPQYGFDEDQVTWLTGGELSNELNEDFVSEFE